MHSEYLFSPPQYLRAACPLEALKVEIKKFVFDFCYWIYIDKQGK